MITSSHICTRTQKKNRANSTCSHSHLYAHRVCYTVKRLILKNTHCYSMESLQNRPYPAYCQYEHGTKHTLWSTALQRKQARQRMCENREEGVLGSVTQTQPRWWVSVRMKSSKSETQWVSDGDTERERHDAVTSKRESRTNVVGRLDTRYDQRHFLGVRCIKLAKINDIKSL